MVRIAARSKPDGKYAEMEFLPQRPSEKLLGDIANLAEPQQEDILKPRVCPPLRAKSLAAQLRVERVGHMIDVAGREPGVIQAESDRALGELMRIVDVRQLAVFDASKPLLLDRDDELAVHKERRG
jgi:hypothetical protein